MKSMLVTRGCLVGVFVAIIAVTVARLGLHAFFASRKSGSPAHVLHEDIRYYAAPTEAV